MNQPQSARNVSLSTRNRSRRFCLNDGRAGFGDLRFNQIEQMANRFHFFEFGVGKPNPIMALDPHDNADQIDRIEPEPFAQRQASRSNCRGELPYPTPSKLDVVFP